MEILMYDGNMKSIEDIVIGDVVMNKNSKASNILKIITKQNDLYKVSPVKGKSFIVAKDHILSLKLTDTKTRKNEYVNITVDEFIRQNKFFKTRSKLYRTPIDFQSKTLPIDPYLLGVILGDGSLRHGRVSVTTPDDEIINELYRYAEMYNLKIRCEQKKDSKASSYYFIGYKGSGGTHKKKGYYHYLRDNFTKLDLMETKSDTKFIPSMYKVSSKTQRLELLAGLIDTDGHLHNNVLEYSTKSPFLKNDVLYLCRSLGLAAYYSDKIVNGVTYYRINISGDISIIPTRVKRKQGTIRKQVKSVLVTGFNLEHIGKGEYKEIFLENENNYLLSDFTVFHGGVD